MDYVVDQSFIPGPVPMEKNPSEFALASVGYIRTDLSNIKTSYIRLGFHLSEFKKYGYYLEFGYSSFEDFVYDNFKLDKSALSRCLSVYWNFCLKRDYVPTMFIDPKYEDYSYSQLCEMVSMSYENRCKVKPDMTIMQIRDLKKSLSKVATSQPVDEKPKKIFDYNKYACLSGAARRSYIKSLDSLNDICVRIFDRNGVEASKVSNVVGELLFKEGNSYYMRIDSLDFSSGADSGGSASAPCP